MPCMVPICKDEYYYGTHLPGHAEPRAWFELRERTTCNSNVQQTNKPSTMREAVY